MVKFGVKRRYKAGNLMYNVNLLLKICHSTSRAAKILRKMVLLANLGSVMLPCSDFEAPVILPFSKPFSPLPNHTFWLQFHICWTTFLYVLWDTTEFTNNSYGISLVISRSFRQRIEMWVVPSLLTQYIKRLFMQLAVCHSKLT